ncbi:Uncharacterised protein [Mycolicibacterium vanbaalenii]|uniref:DUF1360 domain-containing protein n=1 Tax=Mycolicibacterium vanbaalenii TaxID=110539 RepID=A0A5S9R7Y4_MYCVN|nr:DUF1360 domain-containing protein [Mycolicibacterium vanbaalenii]CAA0134571.1 Uncharacterised protein [Mycolicibacterium vanbaalenii]
MNHSLGWTVLILVIYVLAAARITRLINADSITEPARMWIAGRAEAAKTKSDEASAASQPALADSYRKRAARGVKTYDFVICPWCVGFWVSLAGAIYLVPFLLGWHGGWVLPVAFAASHVIGKAAGLAQGD